MNKIIVSDIRLVRCGLRGLLQFYSLSQLISFIASIVIGISIVSVIGYIVFDVNMWSKQGLFFAFVGALPSVFLAREAVFDIGGAERMSGFSAMNDRLIAYGFEKQDSPSGTKECKYEKKLHRFLRWDKSGVCISIRNNVVAISGPYGTLLSLRKFLIKLS